MNARRFDALTVAMTSGAHRASRRRVLRGLAMLAAMGIAPALPRRSTVVRFRCSPPSAASPAIGRDCAGGEICLNGACAPRELSGTGTTGQLVGEPTTGEPAALALLQAPHPLRRPRPPHQQALGDSSSQASRRYRPDLRRPLRRPWCRAGLPAHRRRRRRRYRSRRGPQGALTAIPAEFSTTVVTRRSPICLRPSTPSMFEWMTPIRPRRLRAAISVARSKRAPTATNSRLASRSAGIPPTPASAGYGTKASGHWCACSWHEAWTALTPLQRHKQPRPRCGARGRTRRRGDCAAGWHPGRRGRNAPRPRSQSRHDDRRQSSG